MKIRSSVFWPEHDPPVMANDVIELPDDEAKARIAAGLAEEHVDPAPEPAPEAAKV